MSTLKYTTDGIPPSESKTAVKLRFSRPKYFTRSFSKSSRFSTLSISAKNDFLSSATEAIFPLMLRDFS